MQFALPIKLSSSYHFVLSSFIFPILLRPQEFPSQRHSAVPLCLMICNILLPGCHLFTGICISFFSASIFCLILKGGGVLASNLKSCICFVLLSSGSGDFFCHFGGFCFHFFDFIASLFLEIDLKSFSQLFHAREGLDLGADDGFHVTMRRRRRVL